MRRNVYLVSLQRIGRVRHDVEMSRKAETLAVDRHKRQIDTRRIIHHDGVHDVVVVVCDGYRRRERTDKSVEQQVYIVREYVHRLKQCIHIVVDAAVVEQFIQSFPAFGSHHPPFLAGRGLHILVGHSLAQRHGQYRGLIGLLHRLIFRQHHAIHSNQRGVSAECHAVYLHFSAVYHQHAVFEQHRVGVVIQKEKISPEGVLVQVVVERLYRHY